MVRTPGPTALRVTWPGIGLQEKPWQQLLARESPSFTSVLTDNTRYAAMDLDYFNTLQDADMGRALGLNLGLKRPWIAPPSVPPRSRGRNRDG